MGEVFDKSIVIQKINELTEQWEDAFDKTIHASINKTKADDKYLSAGSTRANKNLTFKVRYFAELEDISLNLELYRIVYRGVPYNVKDYDDYKEKHITVKLLGVSY